MRILAEYPILMLFGCSIFVVGCGGDDNPIVHSNGSDGGSGDADESTVVDTSVAVDTDSDSNGSTETDPNGSTDTDPDGSTDTDPNGGTDTDTGTPQDDEGEGEGVDSDTCSDRVEQRVDEIMAEIDALPHDEMIEVKCDQLRPISAWKTKTVHLGDLTIPGFRYADGPRGVGDGTTPGANGYAAGKATCFPARINQSHTWNLGLIEQLNRDMSEEALASGVNVLLSATVDLIRDPRIGRAQETVGEDPYLAGKVGVATIKGTQATGMIGNLKHYNLNYVEKGRGMVTDILLNQVNDYLVDQRTLIEHYGLPFKMAIQEGNAMSVMAAYNKINGEKCTENANLLTDILREQWGYEYWVIADWTANVSTKKAIDAGLDLDESLLIPSVYQQRLEADVRSGKITMEVLDTSVRRVLRSKLASGIMDLCDRYPDDISNDVINSKAHQAMAKKAALESIVLLENKNDILPFDISEIEKIAVIGPNANLNNALLGDDAIPGSSYVDAAYQVTVYKGFENKVGKNRVTYKEGCKTKGGLLDSLSMNAAVDMAQDADLIVFAGGINSETEGEVMDRKDWTIELPGRQVELINRLKNETKKPIVVVLVGGGSMAVQGFVDNIDALIWAGYPGMEGGNAIADIVFGDYNPSAKLTMTFPVSDDQMPDLGRPGDQQFDFRNDIIDGVGYRYYDNKGLTPQYVFGYGLSYTSFSFSNLKINSTPVDPNQAATTIDSDSLPLTVAFDVTNTGSRDGAEVAQLYLSWDEDCSVAMPVKQLKGFSKLRLSPGETKTVELNLGKEELSFYDLDTRGFITENGTFTVRVGNSSDNTPLVGHFALHL